jgi:hypothetical protein
MDILHLCKCIIRYGYFIFTFYIFKNFKEVWSNKNTKNLLHMNAFSKSKCVSALDTLEWQRCVIYLTDTIQIKVISSWLLIA